MPPNAQERKLPPTPRAESTARLAFPARYHAGCSKRRLARAFDLPELGEATIRDQVKQLSFFEEA